MLEAIESVEYQVRDGGTITVSKAGKGKGWDLAFDFGSDPSLNFTENVPSVPAFMSVVRAYCEV